MRIKVDDMVEDIAGDDCGVRGKVLAVNGQTGKVAGDVPVSWHKVAAVVGAGLALVALLVLLGVVL